MVMDVYPVTDVSVAVMISRKRASKPSSRPGDVIGRVDIQESCPSVVEQTTRMGGSEGAWETRRLGTSRPKNPMIRDQRRIYLELRSFPTPHLVPRPGAYVHSRTLQFYIWSRGSGLTGL